MAYAYAQYRKYQHLPPKPCPPAPLADTGDNGCADGQTDGWGCEPVCCGAKVTSQATCLLRVVNRPSLTDRLRWQCSVPSCPNSVYERGTRIHVDPKAGGCCGNTTKQTAVDGVLCCKTPAAKALELQGATGEDGTDSREWHVIQIL